MKCLPSGVRSLSETICSVALYGVHGSAGDVIKWNFIHSELITQTFDGHESRDSASV